MFEESISIWSSMNSWFTPTVLFVFLNLMIGTIAITSSLATQKQQQQQQQQQPHQLARSPSMLQRLKSINFQNFRSQEAITNYVTNPDLNTHFTFQHEQEPQQQQQQQQQQQTHSTPQQQQQQQQQQPYFSGSPSMLQRLKSINLYSYLSQESTSPSTIHKTQETETTHDSFQQTHEQEPEDEQEEEELEEEQTLDEVYSQLQGKHVNRTKSDTKPASGETTTKLARKMKKSASAKSTFAHFEEEDIVETRRPATVKEGRSKGTDVDDAEVDAKADDFINKFKQQLKLQRLDSIIRRR